MPGEPLAGGPEDGAVYSALYTLALQSASVLLSGQYGEQPPVLFLTDVSAGPGYHEETHACPTLVACTQVLLDTRCSVTSATLPVQRAADNGRRGPCMLEGFR